MHQKDPALWPPCCGGATYVEPGARSEEERAAADRYEASRTAEEYQRFKRALEGTMDVWCAAAPPPPSPPPPSSDERRGHARPLALDA